MNSFSLLPRRTSICHLCRQSLRSLRQQQQQQQQSQHAEPSMRLFARQSLFSVQTSRRRFMSGTTVANFPTASAEALANSIPVSSRSKRAANSADSATATDANAPYTRYSLYAEPATPRTMRPPTPPFPQLVEAEMTAQPQTPAEATQTAQSQATQPTQTIQAADTAESGGEATRATLASATETASAAVTATATATPIATTTTSARPAKRPSRLRTPRKAAMKLTQAAVDQVRALLEGPEPKLLKVGVRNRGCSGLAYNLEYVEKPGAFDELVEQDGVRVLVDSKALFSIIGSEMDWVEDKLSQRFVFRNPNIKEQCGCGESFMV